MDQPIGDTAGAPPRRHVRHRCVWLIWGLFLLLVVYPLSTGPVFRLIVAGYLPKEMAGIYQPLNPVARTPLGKAMGEWYLFTVWKLERFH